MSNQQEMIYQVQYRTNDEGSWRHYYSDVSRADALEMYAQHVSMHSKEQCKIVKVAVEKEVFHYIPVDQQKEHEDE